MSHCYFAEALEKQLEAKKLSQVDLAIRSNISQSQISKWLRAEQTSIDEVQLGALAKALSKEPLDHVELVRAHLMDEKFGPGSELIRIEVEGNGFQSDKSKIKSRGEAAMQYLAEQRMKKRALNDLLIQLSIAFGSEI